MSGSERTRQLQKCMSTECMPSLPGVQPRKVIRGGHHKPQRFGFQADGRIEREFTSIVREEAPTVGSKEQLLKQWHEIVEAEQLKRFAQAQKGARDLGLPTKTIKSNPLLRVQPSWLKHSREVLRFFMYFKEGVFESQVETFRVRRCVCFYYLEDNSIAISEPKEVNSGISQGSFLKRATVEHPNGCLFTPEDFLPGNEVTIYGRTFRCVDLDLKTRNFLTERGIHVPEAEPFPEDEHRRRARIAAQASSLKKQAVENALKASTSPRSNNLSRYLKNDQTLKFSAMWDDSARLYGSKTFYTILYFLADETLEIRMTNRPAGDSFPILLKRSKLPRDTSDPDAGHITPSDLVCGEFLNCWGRKLMLLSCADDFTTSYYERVHGLKQCVVQIKEVPKTIVKRSIPPYNGFGSEADSLANCLNLVPKPVSQDLHRFLNNRGKTLKFKANFVSPGPEDVDRHFLITYYMDDDTVAVYEPPQRNSGILGGKFLERGKYKKPIREKARSNGDLQKLKDEILEKIQSRLIGGPFALLRAFRKFGTDDNGCITFDNFKIGLRTIGIQPDSYSDSQLERLFKLYDNSGDMKIDYQEFVDHVMMDKPIASNEIRFSSRWLRGSDFFVGAIIQFMFPQTGVMTQEFRILSADSQTVDLMADHPAEFPKSNVDAIACMLAETLEENHVNINEAFRSVDVDGKGWIRPEEFGQLLKTWSMDFGLIAEELTEHELLTLVRFYDRDSDGRIYYDEFTAALRKLKPNNAIGSTGKTNAVTIEEATEVIFEKLQRLDGSDLLEKFIELDEDKSGKISWEEFQLMLRRFDIYINNDRDKSFLMLKFDLNGDGLIDYHEFCDGLFSTRFVKEDGQIKKRLVAKEPKELLENETQEQIEADGRNMLEYQALLRVAQSKESVQVQIREMMTNFVAKFIGRRKLLCKILASFDVDNSGRVTRREFAEALSRSNPDYSRDSRLKLVSYLFPDTDSELEYQSFLDLFFSQDINAAISTYGRLINQAQDQEESQADLNNK